VKIDVSYLENPKVIGLHPQAVLLHLASILWTAEQLTDGHIPAKALQALGQRAGIAPSWQRRMAGALVEHYLWLPVEDGWHVHDFAEMNPQATRKKVLAQRKLWRQQKGYE